MSLGCCSNAFVSVTFSLFLTGKLHAGHFTSVSVSSAFTLKGFLHTECVACSNSYQAELNCIVVCSKTLMMLKKKKDRDMGIGLNSSLNVSLYQSCNLIRSILT